MITIHATGRDGVVQTIDADAGATLMEVLRDAGLGIEAICGGQCACATCHCFLDGEWQDKLAPADGDELDLVSACAFYDETRSRLACQIPISESINGIAVTVAPEE